MVLPLEDETTALHPVLELDGVVKEEAVEERAAIQLHRPLKVSALTSLGELPEVAGDPVRIESELRLPGDQAPEPRSAPNVMNELAQAVRSAVGRDLRPEQDDQLFSRDAPISGPREDTQQGKGLPLKGRPSGIAGSSRDARRTQEREADW
jgi:hypothetical protein